MSQVDLDPYLTFDGNAREAMEFYRSVLGGELTVQTFADFGAPVSPEYATKVMHARLQGPDLVLMGSDDQEGSRPALGSNISLSLSGTAPALERLSAVFDRLAADGSTQMPLGPAPWGATFGMCTDRYGVHWLVNVEDAPA